MCVAFNGCSIREHLQYHTVLARDVNRPTYHHRFKNIMLDSENASRNSHQMLRKQFRGGVKTRVQLIHKYVHQTSVRCCSASRLSLNGATAGLGVSTSTDIDNASICDCDCGFVVICTGATVCCWIWVNCWGAEGNAVPLCVVVYAGKLLPGPMGTNI